MIPAVAITIGFLPHAAAAQAQPAIRIGQTITGTLTEGDPSMSDGGRFHVYRLDADAGQRIVATLRSGAFDALLTLMRPISGITETLATDDDGGGGTDARLVYGFTAAGTYHLVVQSYEPGGHGGYTLSVEEAAPERQAQARPLRIGETRGGRIDRSSGLLYDGASEVLYDLYVFDARAGQQLITLMESSDFDAFLSFGPVRAGAVEVTDSDDDSGGGTNARIRITIPADGTYGIHARGLGAGAEGAYTITLREARPPLPRPVEAGGTVDGALGTDDPDADGQNVQYWTLSGSAGDVLRIRMTSDAFDTVVAIGRMEAGVFRELASNDDEHDTTTDSFLEFRLPEAGEYVIRASGYEPGATGAYTLRIETGGR